MEHTDLILLWGSNARETHPVMFLHMLKGIDNGARLIVVDPRRTLSVEAAHEWLPIRVGGDIALANAMGHVIIARDCSISGSSTTPPRASTSIGATWPPTRPSGRRRSPASRPRRSAGWPASTPAPRGA